MKFRKTAALLLTGAFVIGMGTNAMAMEQTKVPSINSKSVYGTYVPDRKLIPYTAWISNGAI